MPVSKKRKNAGKGKNRKNKPIVLNIPNPHLKLQMVATELTNGKAYRYAELEVYPLLNEYILDILGVSHWLEEYENSYTGKGVPIYKIANIKKYLDKAGIDLENFFLQEDYYKMTINILKFCRKHNITLLEYENNEGIVTHVEARRVDSIVGEHTIEDIKFNAMERTNLIFNTALKIIEVMYKEQHSLYTEEAIQGFISKLRTHYSQYIPYIVNDLVYDESYSTYTETDGVVHPPMQPEVVQQCIQLIKENECETV